MQTYVILLFPPLFLLVWAARSIAGRPLSKRSLNIYSSLLLLFYFFVTAGLGLFWVAKQDLPKFDLHYLFGYATLLIVCLTVLLSANSVIRYFSGPAARSPPKEASASLPARFRWMPAFLLAIGALAGFTLAKRGQAPFLLTSPPSGPVGEAGLPLRYVSYFRNGRKADKKVTLGRYFLDEAEIKRVFSLEDVYRTVKRGGSLVFTRNTFRTLALPAPLPSHRSVPLGTAGESLREPLMAFRGSPRDMRLGELSKLLFLANGVTDPKNQLRSAPSSGLLFPTETFFYASHVEGLAPGVYQYVPKGHLLNLLVPDDARILLGLIGKNIHFEPSARDANVIFFFSTLEERVMETWSRALLKKNNFLDVGYIARNLSLGAADLGFYAQLIGLFSDRALNQILQLNGDTEHLALVMPVGIRSERPVREATAFAFDIPASPELNIENVFFKWTSVRALNDKAPYAKGLASSRDAPVETGKVFLPPPASGSLSAEEAILGRRSRRSFSPGGLSQPELSALLAGSFGLKKGLPDPSVEGQNHLELFLIVQRVDGLEPGVYSYDRRDHSLVARRKGLFGDQLYRAALYQSAVRDSAVVFAHFVDMDMEGERDGDRELSYDLMDTGMVSESLYLHATGLRLGCIAIAGVVPRLMKKILGVAEDHLQLVLLTVVGNPVDKH